MQMYFGKILHLLSIKEIDIVLKDCRSLGLGMCVWMFTGDLSKF